MAAVGAVCKKQFFFVWAAYRKDSSLPTALPAGSCTTNVIKKNRLP